MIYELLLAPVVASAIYQLQHVLTYLFFVLIDKVPWIEFHHIRCGEMGDPYRAALYFMRQDTRNVIAFRGGLYIARRDYHDRKIVEYVLCVPGAWRRRAQLGWFYDEFRDKVLVQNTQGLLREVSLRGRVPTAAQRGAMATIGKTFREKGHCVAILSGPPGTGKSALHAFLVQEHRAYGIKCAKLDYGRILKEQETPLVYLVEEFDSQLFTMMKALNPAFRFQVELAELNKTENPFPSKQSWNALLDEINDGHYGAIIVLLTTNVDLRSEDSGSCDESLLRAGRIDHRLEFTEVIGQ